MPPMAPPDGHGLPVDLVQFPGDIVQRLAERRVNRAGEAHDGLQHFVFCHWRHLLLCGRMWGIFGFGILALCFFASSAAS